MKQLLAFTIVLALLSSCTKNSDLQEAGIETSFFRVAAIGYDTTFSPVMAGRVEGIISEDDYLKISYVNYVDGDIRVAVKNKQSCKADIVFEYEQLGVLAISPNTKNSLTENSVDAHQTQIFEITAPPADGAIKVKARSICQWQGYEPAWLCLNLTEKLLPVKFISHKATRIDKYTTRISWEIDAPEDVNRFEVQRSLDGKLFQSIASVNSNIGTKYYSFNVKK